MKKTLFILVLFLITVSSFADEDRPPLRIDLEAVSGQAGGRYTYGRCKCGRITIDVKAIEGWVNLENVKISTPGFIGYSETGTINGRKTGEMFTIGAFDVICLDNGIGFGFKGVEIGTDLDNGMTNIFGTGAHFIFSIVNNQVVVLNLKSGFQYRKKRINMSEPDHDFSFPQEIDFQWSPSPTVRMGMYLAGAYEASEKIFSFKGGLGVEWDFLRLYGFNFTLGFDSFYMNDADLEEYGFSPHILQFNGYVRVSKSIER